jgi:hypothetical protein
LRRSNGEYLSGKAVLRARSSRTKRRTIMSTTTTTLDLHDSVGTETSRSGFWSRAFGRFTAAREASARAMVEGHLSRLSEQSLLELGFEPADIRRIRSRGTKSTLYWF